MTNIGYIKSDEDSFKGRETSRRNFIRYYKIFGLLTYNDLLRCTDDIFTPLSMKYLAQNGGILRDKSVLHSVFTDRQKFTILTFNV